MINKNNRQIILILLIVLLLFSILPIKVFAANTESGYVFWNGTVTANSLGSTLKYFDVMNSTSASPQESFSIDSIIEDWRKGIIAAVDKSVESKFKENISSLPKVTIHYYVFNKVEEIKDADGNVTGYYMDIGSIPMDSSIFTIYEDYLTVANSSFNYIEVNEYTDAVTLVSSYCPYIEIESSDKSSVYQIYFTGKNLWSTFDEKTGEFLQDKTYVESLNSPTFDNIKNCTANSDIVFKEMQKKARGYLLGYTVGFGYNVGSMYSTRQIPLEDAMEWNNDVRGYEFRSSSQFKQSFAFYMHPILGRVEFEVAGDAEATRLKKALTSVDAKTGDWVDYVDKYFPNFFADIVKTSKTSISINTQFRDFVDELDLTGETVNTKGYKVSKKSVLSDGVKRVTNASSTKQPESVISYMVKMAFPYIFVKIGDTYSMNQYAMRVEEGYNYCLFNDIIYDTDGEIVSDRGELDIERSKLYLYNQVISTDGQQKEGILIFGEYEECVIDTTEGDDKGTLYATGRRIGFNNAYSDKLDINTKNKNIMYNYTDARVLEDFLPKNVLFLPNEAEQTISTENYTKNPEALTQGIQQLTLLSPNLYSYDTIMSDASELKNHLSFENNPNFIKIYAFFGQIENKSAINALRESKNANGQNLTDSEVEQGIKAGGLSHYGVFIIRNNRYVNDSSLLSWLTTDEAKSKAYVDTKTLIAKITGDFRSNLEELTYEDWNKMQGIKTELTLDKDNVLVRVFNIMTIIMGTFLIILAILLCLFYWIDIFNTFNRFSLLNFISMNRLYPIENGDLKPMDGDSGVKYVTFKDVLIIAFLLLIAGVFFLEVTHLIGIIIRVYMYIKGLLGVS